MIPLSYPKGCDAILRMQRTSVWPPSDEISEASVALYFNSIFDQFKGEIPEGAEAWADIGCGLALIDALVGKHLKSRGSADPVAYLVDRDAFDEGKRFYRYGDAETFGFYNSMGLAMRSMEANGVRAVPVRAPDLSPVPEGLDLVMSCVSWGFHYPYSTYADEVHRILRPGGVLVLDTRDALIGEVFSDSRYDWKVVHRAGGSFPQVTVRGVKRGSAREQAVAPGGQEAGGEDGPLEESLSR